MLKKKKQLFKVNDNNYLYLYIIPLQWSTEGLQAARGIENSSAASLLILCHRSFHTQGTVSLRKSLSQTKSNLPTYSQY